jgi:hypothetical protein
MVDEGKIEASDVCIFDMTERVAGRLMSLRGLGPDDDLTVDAGGYRTVRRLTYFCSFGYTTHTLPCTLRSHVRKLTPQSFFYS